MADRGGSPERPAADQDPSSLIRSRPYRRLLIFAALLGLIVSLASWLFLEVIHWLQTWTYEDLPTTLGLDEMPWWWPLPVLLVAGALIGVSIERLPGTGGHEPSEGLGTGKRIGPADLPGVLVAALASIGLGMVLGPEAPLIALGSGLTLWVIHLSKNETPDQAAMVLVAASGFAALATIFGSPIIGAIIVIEAAGLGGGRLRLVLLPGLIAAGIGSLVFVGVGSVTGLSNQAYAIAPLSLPAYPRPTLGAFVWTIGLAAVAAVITEAIVIVGRRTQRIVARQRIVLTIVAALAVGVLAIVFGEISGYGPLPVLFSGQEAMDQVVADTGTLSVGVLTLLLVCKGIAWAISLGSARGGPTFPAIFLGVVGGVLATHAGIAEAPAVGVLVGAAIVAVLRLPLSAVVIALVITQGGAGVAPLIIVGVVVSYIVVLALDVRRPAPPITDPDRSDLDADGPG